MVEYSEIGTKFIVEGDPGLFIRTEGTYKPHPSRKKMYGFKHYLEPMMYFYLNHKPIFLKEGTINNKNKH